MGKYDCVIWDWNGTLLDDFTLAISIVNDLLAEYGVETLTAARYRQIFDFPVRHYYERAGLDLSRHDFNEISEKFCSRFEVRLHLARLFPAVPALLRYARESGLRQFLLSGTEQHALHRMTNRFGVTELFECAEGLQDNFAEGKLAAGRALLKRCEIQPDRAVMIGDTTHDADVARHLGMECMLLASGHHSYERLSATGFPIFESLEALSVSLL
jgi:phosphoglycolate phosphatase